MTSVLIAASGCSAPPLEQQNHPGPKPAPQEPIQIDPPDEPVVVPSDPCLEQRFGGVRRLSARQYHQTLKLVLGDGPAKAAVPLPEVMPRGFDTDSQFLNSPSDLMVETMMTNASGIARALVSAAPSAHIPCDPSLSNGSDCAAKTIATLGPLLLRRPIVETDRTAFLVLFERFRASGGAAAGIEALVRSMLLSPSFLFQIDRGQEAIPGADARWLAPHELANRIAYALWGVPADQTLLAAAARGSLSTELGLRAQLEEMLKDPRSRNGIVDFYVQWLELKQVVDRSKDSLRYPRWNSAVANEAFLESAQFVEDNFFNERGSFEHLFTSRTAKVGPLLAELYGVRAGAGKIELPNSERSGILTRIAFLAGGSGEQITHPSNRGAFIMNNLLCQHLPVPPASVEFVPLEPASGPRTTRQALEQAVAGPQCGACHRYIDPIGFTFEGYDAAGVHRRSEKGLPIDSSGVLDGSFDDESLSGKWADANELSAWIPKQTAFKACVAEQYWRYAVGNHINSEEDSCTVKRLTKVLARPGSGLRELVLATLADTGFRQVPVGDAKDVAAPTKGVPEGRTPEETTALVAAWDFETAASNLPKESRDVLRQWSVLFSEMARRFAASKP